MAHMWHSGPTGLQVSGGGTWGCPALGQGQARYWSYSWLPHLAVCVPSQRGGAVQLARLSESKNRLPPRTVKLRAERVRTGGARSRLELPLGSHPSCSLPTLLASVSRDQEAGRAPGVPGLFTTRNHAPTLQMGP